jgi:2,2-dialkylglycine decarboxylase (pyruvate)
MHVTSHVSDPLPAAVGLAVINVIEEEGLVEQAQQRGDYLMAGLRELQNRHEHIGDVRGKGLLVGIELVEDRITKKPADALGVAVGDECLRRGLSMNIVRSTGGMLNCFRMAPPMSITESEIDIALGIIDDALTAVLASRSRQILTNN